MGSGGSQLAIQTLPSETMALRSLTNTAHTARNLGRVAELSRFDSERHPWSLWIECLRTGFTVYGVIYHGLRNTYHIYVKYRIH